MAAVLVALLLAASLGMPAPPGTASSGEPSVHTLAPAPGALVQAGATELRAWLWSTRPVADVRVRVDGAAVGGVTLGAHDPERGTELHAHVDLEPGTRLFRVSFTDAAGGEADRTWQVTATERAVRRMAGATRVDTAVALSAATFPDSGTASAVVLARFDDFADALAGGPLAAIVGGPLLLAAPDALPEATAAELGRVLPPEATVHLLGGPAALGDDVRRAVETLGFRTVRHSGADRYGTAAAVAALLPPSPGVLLAAGRSFPDALAASAPAARDGLPVLLTDTDRLPAATRAALADRAPSAATIVGGAAAVSGDVEHAVRGLVPRVERVAGRDRYATAAAVLDAFFDRPAAAALASGVGFPDALAGARHAAALGQPLLLTEPEVLSAATADALRLRRPEQIDVYGGPVAVAEAVARAAVHAAEDGPSGARVTRTEPGALDTVPALKGITVEVDRAVDLGASSVYAEIGGTELRGSLTQPAAGTLALQLADGQPEPRLDVAHPVHVTVHIRDRDGGVAHHETAFTYLRPDPVFATAGPVELHLPSRHVELVGFHEANHPGAQQQTPRDTATPKTALPSRNRGNGSHTAADIVADPAREVLAPVTGRVVRAGSYVLYCDYTDHFVVIDPDARPGWEVKVLHFHGLQVAVGDRVVADTTVIGAAPRQLPFRSQVDDYTHPRDWPHLHVEVVDPSVPPRPGRGC